MDLLTSARQIPGFESCHLHDAGYDVLTCVALFDTDDGAHEAMRVSREWFRDEWSSFRPVPPDVVAVGGRGVTTRNRRRVPARRRAPRHIVFATRPAPALLTGAQSRT